VTLRLLEPLGALEDGDGVITSGDRPRPESDAGAARVVFQDVLVRAGGHTILQSINLEIEPGSHIGIVGPSGAGKSTLVGLLLGWSRPAEGQVFVDGLPLEGEHLRRIRRRTAWVDPAVQIWNRSLAANLRYGATDDVRLSLETVLEAAELRRLLQALPDGLQTTLGEGGGLVSGGEGQRVRLGRAMLRPETRLVILDEPFRGLTREQRSALLARARELWRGATILCVTHDIGETRAFGRVLVVEGGTVVEDGSPDALMSREDSRYGALLQAEEAVRREHWASRAWRHLELRDGRLFETGRC